MTDSDRFLEDFRETIKTATERLSLISEKQSCIPKADGAWTPKQIIGHLIDSAANNHARFVRAQSSDELDFPGYNGDEWVAVQHYNEEPWSHLVTLWRYYNLHLSHVMDGVPEETRLRPRVRHSLDQIAFHTVSMDQPTTLDYLMRDYVDHLRHHLDQIFTTET